VVGRVVTACLVALAAGCAGGADEELSLPRGQSFAVATSITPRTAAFGDPLTARLRILVDRDTIDPDSIRVLARFQPWRDLTTIERVDAGDLTALTYTTQLHCLTLSCVAFEREYNPRLIGARITSDRGRVVEVNWPEVSIATRVPPREFVPENTGEEAQDWPPKWRATVALPEPTYHVSPALLTWLLAGVGALLVGASGIAGLLLLRRGRLVREREVTQLDRALELLRGARSDEERRAALEALALALDTELDQELAEPARALAWSQSRPSETAAERLAELARGTQ
jgi:hypothetical protein